MTRHCHIVHIILGYVSIRALGIINIQSRPMPNPIARPHDPKQFVALIIKTSYTLCQPTQDRRAPALTALARNGISSRALRLLIACLGMVEQRAAEWDIVDAGKTLRLVREKEERVPLVVGGVGGCGSHLCLLSGDVWVIDGFLVARGHTLVKLGCRWFGFV